MKCFAIRTLFLLLPLAVAAGANPANADGGFGVYEMSVGVLDHDTDGLWSGFSREDGVDLNAEILFDDMAAVLGGKVHPALGVSINSTGDTSKAYGGLRWRYTFESGVFVGLGLGGAVHDGETRLVSENKKALGSRVLFHIPAEVGFAINDNYALSLYFDHVSNGYLADANEGMDTLGLRINYRF